MKTSWFIIAVVFFVVTTVFVVPAASQEGSKSTGFININTATEDQLRTLPFINAQLAHDIILYRSSNGPFFTVDELMNVKGMTQEKYEILRPWIITEGDTTFTPDLNLHQRGTPEHTY